MRLHCSIYVIHILIFRSYISWWILIEYGEGLRRGMCEFYIYNSWNHLRLVNTDNWTRHVLSMAPSLAHWAFTQFYTADKVNVRVQHWDCWTHGVVLSLTAVSCFTYASRKWLLLLISTAFIPLFIFVLTIFN